MEEQKSQLSLTVSASCAFRAELCLPMCCAFPGASACPLVKAMSWCVSSEGFLFCPVVLCVLIALRVGPTHHSGAACLLLQPWAGEVIAFLSSCFLRITEKGVWVLRSGKFINDLTLFLKKKENTFIGV